VGLERIGELRSQPLRGKRIGLVVHGASVTADGTHAIDVLRGRGVNVVRLFAAEHGIRGTAAAGAKIASGTDEKSGLPIVSLYGERNKPTAEDLKGIDALVFDLQDAGVRFYTYMSTMLLCLEAAAENGVEFVVLDRPNPLGGERVEGPVADPEHVKQASLFRTPGPLVHGLTTGEMARHANGLLPKPAKLDVIEMSGWRRSMTWAETGRAWPTPSPNLRSAEAALAYPGTCLLEGTIATEGRGTEAPFLLIGAPWVRSEAWAAAARTAGFALEPARFTPASSEAAPKPKLLGEACQGLRVRVTDPAAASPFALGVALLKSLKALHPEFAWRGDGSPFDRLVGTRRLREAIERGDTLEAILKSDAAAIAEWRLRRGPALLYK
jgi:beta-N-acetylhexosaminidase